MNSLLHDNLAGIRQIKTYVREDEEHRRFNAVSDRLREASLRHHADLVDLQSVDELLHERRASRWCCSSAGAPCSTHRMDFGTFTAILLLVGFLYEPIRQLHSLNQLFQSGRAAGDRVFEIIDTPARGRRRGPGFRDRRARRPVRHHGAM